MFISVSPAGLTLTEPRFYLHLGFWFSSRLRLNLSSFLAGPFKSELLRPVILELSSRLNIRVTAITNYPPPMCVYKRLPEENT